MYKQYSYSETAIVECRCDGAGCRAVGDWVGSCFQVIAMNGPMWSYSVTVGPALSPDVFRGASRYNVIGLAPLSHGGDGSE